MNDALIAHRKAREAGLAQERQVKAAADALSLSLLRYRNGVSAYLSVLDSQRELLNAQLSLSLTRRLQLVALVQFYRALGGGWE